MIFVTYNAETGALISVTSAPPEGDITTCTRAINTDSVTLETWDAFQRAFREELGGEPTSRLTRLAFRNRFTMNEKAAMELAALDSPAAPLAQRQQSAVLRAHMADVATSTFVDLQRAETRSGVLMLEAAGLLAPGRAIVILDAPVEPHEAHVGV